MKPVNGTEKNEPEKGVPLSTAQLPQQVIDMVRLVRSARKLTTTQVYQRVVMPALEREWAAIVREEGERLRKEDPLFTNELGGEG